VSSTADALRAQWLRIARRTDRCDRPAAEAAVGRLYRQAGLAAPVPIWVESPLAGLLAATLLQHHPDGLRDRLPARPDGIGGPVTGLVAERLREPAQRVDDVLVEQLEPLSWLVEQEAMVATARMVRCSPAQLRRLPTGRTRDALLYNPLFAARLRLVEERLSWRVADRVRHHVDPCRAAGPLAAHQRVHDGPDALVDAVREVGWWWPLRGAVVLADRPTALHLDPDGRPHRDGGPAIEHADGFAVHAWHGTRVPAELVTGAGWSVERILAEPNAEVRRCAIERTGWERFAATGRLRQVGPGRPDPGNPGQVLRLFELPDELAGLYPEPARLLLATNASADRDGTRRTFGLPVPADVPDALSAAALTFGVSRAEYGGLSRAT
jgi:hypothetical protein